MHTLQVAWIHIDRQMILTIHRHVISRIPRYSITYTDNTWLLHVNQAHQDDRGYYMCQVNTNPMISQVGYLQVVGEYPHTRCLINLSWFGLHPSRSATKYFGHWEYAVVGGGAWKSKYQHDVPGRWLPGPKNHLAARGWRGNCRRKEEERYVWNVDNKKVKKKMTCVCKLLKEASFLAWLKSKEVDFVAEF